ncbi:hypothetical protein ABZ654_07460 [Streptomyces hygroscopicus]|uniref:hypothetical protein n=1 Tax=Streptomyces hygroscopicus TaxID=1912 RepID=UPI00340A4136
MSGTTPRDSQNATHKRNNPSWSRNGHHERNNPSWSRNGHRESGPERQASPS